MDTAEQHAEIFRTVSALSPAELAAFVAVAQFGGFRAAARRCNLSPSALSHSVANLENRLNVQLFHRSTRNVSLTNAGQRFFTRLEPALDEIAKAADELGDFNARPSGTLRINSDATAAEQVLRPLVLKFMGAFPEVQVEIVSERRLVDIAEHGFDCGIRSSEIVSDDMIAVPIGPMQQHVVVAAPATSRMRLQCARRPIWSITDAFNSGCPAAVFTAGNSSGGEKLLLPRQRAPWSSIIPVSF
jgi:DNA-binding transcriptional LysR family regulator